MRKDYKLKSNDKLTAEIKRNGIDTWNELTAYVRQLPYGRNSNRTDLELVIAEQKGTCSSKHALLKKVADLNGLEDVKLILGIYKMNAENTPNIGNVMTENSIDFIPEAHCYLKIDDDQIDFTNENSDFEKIKRDVISEIEIEPEQVAEFKVEYHKQYLKGWIAKNPNQKAFDEIWRIREDCIKKLAEKAYAQHGI